MTKWVLTFGGGAAEGRASMAKLLGGKGANLAEMASIGLPVPPGFTITTEACSHYFGHGKTHPAELEAQVDRGLAHIEALTGRRFGDPENPLLVSVRSGSRASMPGMMDTILNLGLNDETVEAIAKSAGDRRFAYDSYRRFIQMYADVVLGVDHHEFEDLLEAEKEDRGVVEDVELSEEDLVELVAAYKAKVEDELGEPFPDDPREQLWGAIGAVFSSWMNPRAITYRAINGIPVDWGTAVNVQAMVFGNMGETSATGVAFTRDPSTGEKLLYGEFLVNAQGEDVVSGLRTPQPLTEAVGAKGKFDAPSLETRMPEVFAEFREVAGRLEAHYRDMQDIEFTVERGKLWMLQTRSGKRATKAAIKIAVDLVEEGVLMKEEAVTRVDPASLDQLLHPTLDPTAPRTLLTTGLPASPGAAQGVLAFSSEAAEAAAGRLDEDKKRRKVILVRIETSPEDIGGMHVAAGILTSRGGMTSHAAVVARGMGKPCVSGAGQIRIDERAQTLTVAGKVFRAGDVLTIDGSTGQVLEGAVPMIEPELSGEFGKLIGWADGIRRMKVRANAETPDDARAALSFGAEGIGLARTEHMFFDEARIIAVREMILAENDATERGKALDKLLPYQRADFRELFEIMKGFPIAIRLLDPPLHEFLPHTEKEIADVAADMGTSPEKLKAIAAQLAEFNPMLGFRGCRLAIAHPEIADMQARAIFEAAVQASAANGGEPIPCEIMVPLVIGRADFDFVKARIDQVAKQVAKETGATLSYQVGAMIELPRAALRAGDIAETAAFFSFGTNDLTQTALGVSRDDAGPFLNHYVQKKLLDQDPFVTVDREGVGELVEIAAERGRKVRPDIKLGICGEHGGDPASIHFCEEVGLDYVSCSPFRVPIARLAAAQATLKARARS